MLSRALRQGMIRSGSVVVCADPGVPALGPSGASAHVRGVATALRAPIVCVHATDRRGIGGEVGVPVHGVGLAGWPRWAPRQGLREVRTARRCAERALDLEPTLVWERHSLYSDAGWKVHAASGARWVLEVNAPLADERERYGGLPDAAFARAWERDVLLAAPEIVAVSAWLVEWLRSLGCQKVRHLPNGVALHVGRRAETRARLSLDDRFVLGFVGSMRPWHGVERMPALLDALPDAVGVIVGEGGPTHPRLVRLGHRGEADVADVIAAMDVGLAPYGADAPPWFCPLKVLAYRAQGTPVVASDIGDTRLLVGDGGTLLSAGSGAAAWVEAIDAWRGRRAEPWVRSWGEVVAEGLGARDQGAELEADPATASHGAGANHAP